MGGKPEFRAVMTGVMDETEKYFMLMHSSLIGIRVSWMWNEKRG